MIKNKKAFTLIFLLIFSVVNVTKVFADSTTPEPYNTDEFPQTLKDLRRFEIITLGAMPFITLDATIAYSGYKSITEGTQFNPFATSTYTQDEQFKIILTSLCISTGVGLFDYVYNLLKRNISTHKKKKVETSYINVTPIAEDPDAIKIDIEDIPYDENQQLFEDSEEDSEEAEEEIETFQEIEESELEVIE